MSTAYPLFGAALNASGRPMVFVCSWPAYAEDHCEGGDVIGKVLAKGWRLGVKEPSFGWDD